MPTTYRHKHSRHSPEDTPTIGEQAKDGRSLAARKLRKYLQGDDSERFDMVKDNLSAINFFLSEQAVDVAKGTSRIEMGKLVQLCTALGISYDKLYAKRDMGLRPLSFPEPLLKMVKQGLELAKNVSRVKPLETPPPVDSPTEASVEHTPIIEPVVPGPVVRTRYKSAAMQAAHEALCPDVPVSKTIGVNPRAEYRKAYSEKIKAAQAEGSGGSGVGSSQPEGAGAYPQAGIEP